MTDSGRGTGPDFIEALARGLDVLRSFRAGTPAMTLSEIAGHTGLARPTVRRILITLEALGYVRAADRGYALTPRVLDLGMAYVNSLDMWDVARPHMERLVALTGESTSMAQLDGSDIVYVARVAVPKIVTLAVSIGTRFPAAATSMGKVLLAALDPAQLEKVLAEPDLALGIRSIAAGVRNGDGKVVAALNVTVHAAETSVDKLTGEYLPLLLHAAADISHDWSLLDTAPMVVRG